MLYHNQHLFWGLYPTTHSPASPTMGPLKRHHSATLFAPGQIGISFLPSRSETHFHFLPGENRSPHASGGGGAICCFLLLWFFFPLSSASSVLQMPPLYIVEICQETGTGTEKRTEVFLTRKCHKQARRCDVNPLRMTVNTAFPAVDKNIERLLVKA